MTEKRRLKGYQHLSASGHLGAVVEGPAVFNDLLSGIEETKNLFVFLDKYASVLDPENTDPISYKEWSELKKVIASYAKKHTEIERSQVLFVLTILKGIGELSQRLREQSLEQIKEQAGDQNALDYWLQESETALFCKDLMQLFFLGRQLKSKSPYLREHLWAVAGRALKNILIPFYRYGQQLDKTGWWEYFVQQGWVTPLCHIRHPHDAIHAEEWRKGLLQAIIETPATL